VLDGQPAHVARELQQRVLETGAGTQERDAHSRAVRTAATAPSSLRYGLPGTSQIASKPSSTPAAAASSVGTQ
jgi:hypothetical protein